MRGSRTLIEGATPRRILALAFAPIVVMLAVGVGAVVLRQEPGDGVLVTATGQGQAVNEPGPTTPPSSFPDTATVPVPAPSVTAPTPPPATTAPAPVAAPSLTPAPPASAPVAEESTSDSSQAQIILANDFTGPVVVNVNGQSYALATGQRLGPVAVTPAPSGNDIIEVSMASEPTCGVGDAQGYFRAGSSYVLRVTTSPGQCLGAPRSPTFAIAAA